MSEDFALELLDMLIENQRRPDSVKADAALMDLIRAHDTKVRDEGWSEGFAAGRHDVLRGLTEEVTVRMIARRVPCDCPGDWQHHARVVGDDSPATHIRHDMVPSRRYVTPWEPTT